MGAYWRTALVVFAPIISYYYVKSNSPNGITSAGNCGIILLIMATFWVTEALPLTITSFIPMFAFPLLGIMDSAETCQAYLNDTVLMFIGSLFLAYAIELSGLHVRLALFAIRTVGYSHNKMLFALSFMTMFVSMWITNTAATTMMVPIIFAILRVLEKEGIGSIYVMEDGIRIPSRIAVCYFCAATFSATIGGIGTLVGTGTNLAFKGLFEAEFPRAPSDTLSFPRFSSYTVPYMFAMEFGMYFWLSWKYFGLCSPNSKAAKEAALSSAGVAAAKLSVDQQSKNLGPMNYHELAVVVLFALAMSLFFTRWPGMFRGWAAIFTDWTGVPDDLAPRYIRDSAVAMGIVSAMILLPASFDILKHLSAKYLHELPTKQVKSVLDWHRVDSIMPWAFAFLLGGGFALSTGARKTGLDKVLSDELNDLKALPVPMLLLMMIIVTIFITNFASNVAVANVICPIAMKLAVSIEMNPVWMCMLCGLSCSHCFMLPVGTPGNLVVQSALGMRTGQMIEAGGGVTAIVIFFTWAFGIWYFPFIWPTEFPDWAREIEAPPEPPPPERL